MERSGCRIRSVGRESWAGEPVTDLLLEVAVAPKTELRSEADDRGAARPHVLGQVGNRPKGQESGVGQHGLRDPALGGRQTLVLGGDQLGEGHLAGLWSERYTSGPHLSIRLHTLLFPPEPRRP